MSRVPLRLERINDRDVHDDLMLRLGTYRHVCDSYYLAVDESARAGQEVSDSLVLGVLDDGRTQIEMHFALAAHGGDS